MSRWVGLGFFWSSAAAAMICPDWQYPHCGTSIASHAFCTGCEELGERPSMVTILSVGFTSERRIEQARCTSPLMWTEQAPHWAMPQPNFVPVSPTCSRITHRSGMSGSACTSRILPLMLSLAMSVLSRADGRAPVPCRHEKCGNDTVRGGALPTAFGRSQVCAALTMQILFGASTCKNPAASYIHQTGVEPYGSAVDDQDEGDRSEEH